MPNEDYAGDITSTEAWNILATDSDAVMVDVRSEAEWEFVGKPDLASLEKTAVYVSWQTYPAMERNPSFTTEIHGSGVAPASTVLLLCRSGNRSRSAAIELTALGYTHCYNVVDGFEGPLDELGQRNTISGWKAAGLPWTQG